MPSSTRSIRAVSADSNDDGIGDLNGITSKLGYLQELGVDAIWITPCFPSPQVDFGYDVSDYENIDPMYGTLADFDHMQKDAQQRRHSHHPGLRAEPHLGPEHVVHRFPSVRALRRIATGTSGEMARAEPAAKQLGIALWRIGVAVGWQNQAVLLPLLSIPSSQT